MATILDIGILNYFVPAFVFLLIYGIVLAILEKTKIFGDNKAINQILAFSVGVLFILTPDLVGVIRIITPWFTIMWIFIFLIIAIFLFVGISQGDVAKAFREKTLIWIIVVISIGIFIFALTQAYGTQIHSIYAGENATEQSGLNQAIGQILFHPRVLGMLFLLVVAAQAVKMISGSSK
ncbi:hypothetical protein D6777_04610 [Candidatus Woesearchaeota archaeon]|nr:MAG: hypothetical protein D6777_04610 [Candidatus Woesearchaeota archaeon]